MQPFRNGSSWTSPDRRLRRSRHFRYCRDKSVYRRLRPKTKFTARNVTTCAGVWHRWRGYGCADARIRNARIAETTVSPRRRLVTLQFHVVAKVYVVFYENKKLIFVKTNRLFVAYDFSAEPKLHHEFVYYGRGDSEIERVRYSL